MSTRRAAELKAERLASDHAQAPPVDVETIARSLGVQVRYEDLDDATSGLLIRGGNNSVIAVNRQHARNRQRFTIAHELGHAVLHADSPTTFVDGMLVHFRADAQGGGPDPREVEANAFAAALLMPSRMVRQALRGQPIDAFDETQVNRLAALFGVSAQALTIRLTNLKLVR